MTTIDDDPLSIITQAEAVTFVVVQGWAAQARLRASWREGALDMLNAMWGGATMDDDPDAVADLLESAEEMRDQRLARFPDDQ